MRSTRTLTIVRTADARGTSDCRGDRSDATGTESEYSEIRNGHRTDQKMQGTLALANGPGRKDTRAVARHWRKRMQRRTWRKKRM